MTNNPFLQFKDAFPNSEPKYTVGESTYRKLPYDLQKCYEALPMTAESNISIYELEERGIPYSTEGAYKIKNMYSRLFDNAIKELGLDQEQPREEVSRPVPMDSDVPLYELAEQQRSDTQYVGGKRRSRKSRKSRKPKRKSRKPKRKSRKSRK
jgi:hypothetical protein